jgi:4-amino-4-deoxy-L-arabinose transferase-like glycosyltransferase
LLFALLAVSLVLSVLFALRVPFDDRIGANPDETRHFDYLRLLVEHRGLVTFNADDPTYAETHQPPLYYLLCLPVYLATGGSVFAVRMVNAVLQLLTVALAWRAGRDLFPSRAEVAAGAAAFVALLPTQAQLAASVNNDGPTTLLCLFLFWRAARFVRGDDADLRGALVAGAAFGLGLLTKLNVLQLVPALLVAAFLAVVGGRVTAAGAARWVGVTVGLGLLIASPWLVRNTLLYGDPLTVKLFPAFEKTTATPTSIRNLLHWSFGDYVRNNALRTYATFWYLLPPNALIPDLPRFALTAILGIGGLVGALRGPERSGVTGDERRVVLLSVATLFLLVPFFVRFNLQFFQAQGRYFLPALLPAALLAVVGWGNATGKRAGAAIPLSVVLLGLCLFQLTLY